MSSQLVECTQCHNLIEINITAMEMTFYETDRILPDTISDEDRDMLVSEVCSGCWDVLNS